MTMLVTTINRGTCSRVYDNGKAGVLWQVSVIVGAAPDCR
jgi:hypothetical protein